MRSPVQFDRSFCKLVYILTKRDFDRGKRIILVCTIPTSVFPPDRSPPTATIFGARANSRRAATSTICLESPLPYPSNRAHGKREIVSIPVSEKKTDQIYACVRKKKIQMREYRKSMYVYVCTRRKSVRYDDDAIFTINNRLSGNDNQAAIWQKPSHGGRIATPDGGLKGSQTPEKERERESRKTSSETSCEVGSGYAVNDLLKDGSRRRGPLR